MRAVARALACLALARTCDPPPVALLLSGASRTLPLVVENIEHSHVDAIGRDCVDVFALIEVAPTQQGPPD